MILEIILLENSAFCGVKVCKKPKTVAIMFEKCHFVEVFVLIFVVGRMWRVFD